MRTLPAALNLAVATVLTAGCHSAAEPPAKAAEAPGAAPAAATDARPVPPRPAVGALFLGGTDTHTCTASVVDSTSGDLIVTAAHCLAAGLPATFVPGFNDSAAADDGWNNDTVYHDSRRLATQDPKADYAFARVSRPAGGTVEAVAGQALTLGTAQSGPVTVIGYPMGEGGPPLGCDTNAGSDQGYPWLRCNGLGDGTSGGPWIRGATVVGVIGGRDGGGCQDNVSYSSPFDGATAALLARAQAGGPGDDAPQMFDSEC
jgi:hypothetical protein